MRAIPISLRSYLDFLKEISEEQSGLYLILYYFSLPLHSSICTEELCRIYRDSWHCGWNLPAFGSHLKHTTATVS